MKQPKSPFDVTLSKEQTEYLAHWLCREVRAAIDAKAHSDQDVDYWWQLYEQARTRFSSPWPDAADLTSYIAAEKVDAIQARGMRTIWSDPIWTVEGWGDAAERAPFVEEFSQWKAEEERLQNVLDKLWLAALIEPRGLLEVYEGVEYRVQRRQMNAALQTDPLTGGPVSGEDGQPLLATSPDGKFVEATGDQPFQAVTVIDEPKPVRSGPNYRILPYRDSVMLPGHARDQTEIWGYGKRLWKRLSEIQRQALSGVYDADAVAQLPATSDREPDAALKRAGQDVAPQQGVTSEKELWEATVLLDLDALFVEVANVGKAAPELRGSRWYVVTLALDRNLILRIQHDDFERCRYLPVILFPRADRATEGYSLVGHKLITVVEEHSAWRNMQADRGKLLLQAPILRQQGALWDPDEQPFGPTAVIDVRSPQEIAPFPVSEAGMAEGFQHIAYDERAAEKIAGVNDIAAGQTVQGGDKTLGEIQMATEQSFVRMDAIIRRFQEFMEDLGSVRLAIWKRCLAEQPDGMQAPQSLLVGLEGRGVSIDQYLPNKTITADLLDGAFRFKPRGSVESADKNRQRMEFSNLLQVIPSVLQVFPALVPMFQSPQAARAIMRQILYLWDVPNQQAFLGSPAQDLMQTQQLAMQPQGMPQPPMLGQPMPPGQPGQPPAPGQPPPNPISAMAAQLAQKFGSPSRLMAGPTQPQ